MINVLPRTLRLRLMLAYVGVFSAALLVFAVAVHEAFEASLEQQITARLAALAGAGVTDVTFGARSFRVAFRVDRILRRDEEGIEWFDVASHLVAEQGLVPPPSAPPRTNQRESFHIGSRLLNTYTVSLRDGRGRLRGFVRAGAADTEYRETLARLDVDLFLGSLLALGIIALAGYALSSEASRRTEAEIARLAAFTADASHQLRGPLTAIASNVDATLRDPAQLPSPLRRRLLAIYDAVAQMRRLTDDLLLLAGAGQPLDRDLFVVRLDEIVTRVYDLYEQLAREGGVEMRLERCADARAYGNPDQLQRIVANLVENAIRYTGRGGFVEIECSVDRTTATIAVRDSGIGIADEHLERIFERFARVDPARRDGGAGLGLAVARALAERHSGTISVESRLGIGSRFTLTLPRLASAPAASGAAEVASKPRPVGTHLRR